MDEELLDRSDWWSRRSIRLAVLGLCLLGAIALLLKTKTSLFAARSSSASAAAVCEGRPLPSVGEVDLTGLVALRAGLLAGARMVGGRPYAVGATNTSMVWADNPPLALRSARSRAGRWPAGFEMRLWSPDRDDIGLSVLELANAHQARRLASQLSGQRCHRDSVSGTPPGPQGARDITWINPLGYWQEDLVLPRGRLVYRIAEVRARSEAIGTQRAAGLRSVEMLSCALTDADCKGGQPPARSTDGAARGLSSRARTSRPLTSSPATTAG